MLLSESRIIRDRQNEITTSDILELNWLNCSWRKRFFCWKCIYPYQIMRSQYRKKPALKPRRRNCSNQCHNDEKDWKVPFVIFCLYKPDKQKMLNDSLLLIQFEYRWRIRWRTRLLEDLSSSWLIRVPSQIWIDRKPSRHRESFRFEWIHFLISL